MRLIFVLAVLSMLACSSAPEKQRRFVIEKSWVKSTLKDDQKGYSFTPQMSPALVGDLVVQGNSYDGIVAYDQLTGVERWRIDVPNGVNSGVDVNGDEIYFGGSDGQFYAASYKNGKVRWTFPTRAENLSSPVYSNGVVYFLSGNNIVFALDAKTGRQKWVYDRAAATTDLSVRGGTKPAVFGKSLYVGFTDGFIASLNLSDGSLQWERQLNTNPKFKDVDASPLVTEKYIFVASFDNALYCLTREDGQVQWKHEEGSSFSVAMNENTLYYGTSTGVVKALNATSGNVLWTNNLKHGVASKPSFYKGVLVYGESSGSLRVVEASNGKELGKFEPGWGVLAPPTMDAKTGRVYFMSTANNLHALKIGWKFGPDLGPFKGM